MTRLDVENYFRFYLIFYYSNYWIYPQLSPIQNNCFSNTTNLMDFFLLVEKLCFLVKMGQFTLSEVFFMSLALFHIILNGFHFFYFQQNSCFEHVWISQPSLFWKLYFCLFSTFFSWRMAHDGTISKCIILDDAKVLLLLVKFTFSI